MDLAIGAKSVFVLMELLTRDGQSKLVEQCTYPLTGVACVSRVYTDLAVLDLKDGRVVLADDCCGVGAVELSRLTGLDIATA
jgi:3-oxoadipate CoA-transferase beta subunit